MSGKAVANWLKSKNIEVLITSHVGEKPFETLLNKGLKVYFAGDERIELKDVMIKYADGDLTLLTNENFHTFLKEDNHHSKNCSKTNQKLENKLQRPLYKSFIRNIHY